MFFEPPSSFATLCTKSVIWELLIFLDCVSAIHTNSRVFIVCDKHTDLVIKKQQGRWDLEVTTFIYLDSYSNLTRVKLESLGLVTEFWNNKSLVIELALKEYPDVLYLDCDVILLEKVLIPRGYQLGLSPQFIPQRNSQEVGFYNGGFVYSNDHCFPALWRKANKTSRYLDQASLEVLALYYSEKVFEFDEGHNIQPWRPILSADSGVNWYESITKHENYYINFKKIKSFHTHLNDKRFLEFNNFIMQVLENKPIIRKILTKGIKDSYKY